MLTEDMSRTIEMALLMFKSEWQQTNKSDEERMAALDKIEAAQRWLYKEQAALAAIEAPASGVGEWAPIPDGTYHTDGPEIFSIDSARLTVYQGGWSAHCDLPYDIHLFRWQQRAPAPALPEPSWRDIAENQHDVDIELTPMGNVLVYLSLAGHRDIGQRTVMIPEAAYNLMQSLAYALVEAEQMRQRPAAQDGEVTNE